MACVATPSLVHRRYDERRNVHFPSIFNDTARGILGSPSGAYHGQPSYRNCMRSRNADGACFSTVLEGNQETMCGFGKPCAVLMTPPCRNTVNSHTIYNSPNDCLAALGDCHIWRYHFIQPQCLWTHLCVTHVGTEKYNNLYSLSVCRILCFELLCARFGI